MREKSYNKIKNTIIAGASSGIVAGMFLVGGMNSVYAETVNRVIPVYTHKKMLDKSASYNQTNKNLKKHSAKGWRKNQNNS